VSAKSRTSKRKPLKKATAHARTAARTRTLQWRVAVGRALKNAREDAGQTQDVAAAGIGWSREKLALMESGKGKTEYGEVMMAADYYHIPRDVMSRRINSY